MLDELKPVADVALVCGEEETASVECLTRCVFCGSDFGTELDAAAEDATVVDVQVEGWTFEIVARIHFSGVRCEWASVLCRDVLFVDVVVEIVVLLRVSRDHWIIPYGRKVNGCSCAPSSQSV